MKLNALFHPGPAAAPKVLSRAVSDEQISGSSDTFSAGEALGWTAGGAAAGGAIGTLVGLSIAGADVHSKPINSVTESWREPTTKDSVIGKIPEDQYYHSRYAAEGPDLEPTDPVHEQVPTFGPNGLPVYHNVTQTFTHHGLPVVTTNHNILTMPTLTGSTFNVHEDTHRETYDTGKDSDGHETTSTREVTDGYWTRFDPTIKQQPVQTPDNTYDTKSVKFETGVNVGKMALNGFLYGAGLGAAAGLTADVAHQILSERHPG
jgi:hypothetical protein